MPYWTKLGQPFHWATNEDDEVEAGPRELLVEGLYTGTGPGGEAGGGDEDDDMKHAIDDDDLSTHFDQPNLYCRVFNDYFDACMLRRSCGWVSSFQEVNSMYILPMETMCHSDPLCLVFLWWNHFCI